ncbi:MAG: sulfotransferase domain-containing protein, partial [Candidatus Paceibacterota bacterium]
MKVNFFIIGAPKSGTTSLKQHLSQHSKIVTHKSIECAFFHDESEYNKGEEYLFQKYFFNQKEYNNDCFGLVKQSSAFYYNDTIKRALDYDSEIQFILVCRNPIERYISSYFMEVERSAYSKSIEESIELAFNDKNSWEYKGLNMYGKYDRVIDNLFKIIPLQNFHIVLFEDLKKSPEVVLSCLQSKLNIESQLLDLYQYKAVNAYKVSQSKLLTTIYNKVKRSNSV